MLQEPLVVTEFVPSYRMQAIKALTEFRLEWEAIADGASLLDMQTQVGLMLSDIADRLEMTPQEKYVFLGRRLIGEISTIMNQPIGYKPVE